MRLIRLVAVALMLTAGLVSAAPVDALSAFEQAVRQDASLDASAKAHAEKIIAKGKSSADSAAEAVPEALCALYPRYREALVAFAAGELGTSQKTLKELIRPRDGGGASRFLAAYAQLELARSYAVGEKYEDALPLLASLLSSPPAPTAAAGEIIFLLGTSEARLLQRDKAIEHLEKFLKDFPNAPERMQIAAKVILGDLLAWRDGSLEEAQTRMDDSRRRLVLEDAGKQTRQQQDRVVAILDKLIEEAEKQDDKKGGGSGQGQGQGQPQPGSSGGPPNGNQQPGSPASDSSLPGGQGRIGALNRVTRGNPAESWGNMKDREREAILNAAKSQIPDRYRELIEQYYKGLQKERE